VHIGPLRGRQVIAYLSGEMTPSQRERFEAHLTRCPSCAHEVSSRRPVLAVLDADRAAGVDVPAELGQRIRARLRSRDTRRATPVAWRPHRMPQAAAAAAAMCFLAVGLAIGYVAGQPEMAPGVQPMAELPRVNEEQLLRDLMAARQQLVASGKTTEPDVLKDLGRLLEQLAELKGNDISHVREAAPMPAPPTAIQPMPLRPTTPAERKKEYKSEIAADPGSSKAARAQVKLAELHFRLGEFRQAEVAYNLFKTRYPEQYRQYARRAEVDQRSRLLAECKKDAYRTLAFFREAADMRGQKAFSAYAQIIERQPMGRLARMAIMEMAKFEWIDGRPIDRTERTLGSPQEKIAVLGSLVELVDSPDIGALAQITIADIYRDELGDMRRASEVYETVYEKYPEETRMASEARGRMNRLVVVALAE